jgi:hypothetical protein
MEGKDIGNYYDLSVCYYQVLDSCELIGELTLPLNHVFLKEKGRFDEMYFVERQMQ